MPITREKQLELALAHAREWAADLQRRHEASERAWAAKFNALQSENERIKSLIAADVVRQSRQGVH